MSTTINAPTLRGPVGDKWTDTFSSYLAEFLARVHDDVPPRLWSAMTYSLNAGGKRLRPCLCLSAADASGADAASALPAALAIEMIHTASLIHDDLPCMDDDVIRRGKPTCHVVYGDALAMLAADSLWIWAFGAAASGLRGAGVPADRALRALEILSLGAGPGGMCGGQALDIDPNNDAELKNKDQRPKNKNDLGLASEFRTTNSEASSGPVWTVASMKTAALIRASLLCGAAIGGADDDAMDRWAEAGTHLGLAFQITDDILDVTGDADALGKTPNKDARDGKRTFVSVYGIDEARRLAREECEGAADAFYAILPPEHELILLARTMARRTS